MSMFKASVALWASCVVAANAIDQFQLPLVQPLVPFGNFSVIDSFWEANSPLEPRQACYSPNGYCSNTGKCCPPGFQRCCPGGCGDESQGECCASSQCKADTPQCCGNLGCTSATSECCLGGGSCPKPFICVLYEGQRGCCTDLYCTVYLSDTVTKTRAPAQTIVATAPTATQVLVTATQKQTVTTTPLRTSTTFTQLEFSFYQTTIYWSYWYYFYTIYRAPSTITTRTVTTVTSTTTVTCSATDTYAAQSIFRDARTALPTPASAEKVIPASPTAGAILIGDCSPATSAGITTSSCESVTAGSSTSAASSRGSTASSASIAGLSGGAASGGAAGGGDASLLVSTTFSLLSLLCVSLIVYL